MSQLDRKDFATYREFRAALKAKFAARRRDGYVVQMKGSRGGDPVYLVLTQDGPLLVPSKKQATVWDDPDEAERYARAAGHEFEMAYAVIVRGRLERVATKAE